MEKEHPNDEFANKFYIDCSELNITQQRSIDHIEFTSLVTGQRLTYYTNLESGFITIQNGTLYRYNINAKSGAVYTVYYTVNGVTYFHSEIVYNNSSSSQNFDINNNLGFNVYANAKQITLESDKNNMSLFVVEYCKYLLESREKLYMLNKQNYREISSLNTVYLNTIESMGFPNDDYTFEDMHIKGVPTS